MTREKLIEEKTWRCVLQGAVYSSNAVHQAAGLPCSIATKIHTGHMELAQNDFFAETNGQYFVIYEVLLPDKQPLHFARKFRRTGQHEAIHCSQETNFCRPAWWTVEDNSVLCLL